MHYPMFSKYISHSNILVTIVIFYDSTQKNPELIQIPITKNFVHGRSQLVSKM